MNAEGLCMSLRSAAWKLRAIGLEASSRAFMELYDSTFEDLPQVRRTLLESASATVPKSK